ncbi:bone morphogenetic protein 3-like isoform X2 [Artemia franciscana]|uniref:bone morphogenetic protein 3-like isoform X2 n=1 Tax=Artemia franciscana TaxID=6661 RepID=UPI0032DA5436
MADILMLILYFVTFTIEITCYEQSFLPNSFATSSTGLGHAVPEYMLHLYQKFSSVQAFPLDNGEARCFLPKKDLYHGKHVLVFDISSLATLNEEILSANIYFQDNNVMHEDEIIVFIKDAFHHSKDLQSLKITNSGDKLTHRDVTHAVNLILKGDQRQLLIISAAFENHIEILLKMEPFVVVFSKEQDSAEKRPIRHRRSIHNNEIDNNIIGLPVYESAESRSNEIVDPKKFDIFSNKFIMKSRPSKKHKNKSRKGSKYIPYPRGYKKPRKFKGNKDRITLPASWLKGSNMKTHQTNYALLSEYLQKLRAVPESRTRCCIPKELTSLTLLYFDENRNVVLKNYPQMSALSCTCY